MEIKPSLVCGTPSHCFYASISGIGHGFGIQANIGFRFMGPQNTPDCVSGVI